MSATSPSVHRWFIADEDEDLSYPVATHEAGTYSAPSTAQSSGEPQAMGGSGRGMRTHRIVVMRGVVWRADAVEPLRLWQALARFWPVPLAPEATHPHGAVLAHSGTSSPPFSP
jgi:hypothetical protein